MFAALKLDEGYDVIAREGRASVWSRVVTACLLAVLLGLNLGLRLGSGWFAVMLVVEGLQAFNYPDADAPMSRRRRLRNFAGLLAIGTVWTTMPALYWFSGHPGLQLVAVVQLASLLLIVANYAFRSLVAAVACGVVPALALIALPLLGGHFHGFELLTVALVFFLVPANFSITAKTNIDFAKSLAKANRELETAHAGLLAKHAALEEQTRLASDASRSANDANRAKSTFLAIMSHELRTPMNGVLGMAQALQRSPLDARQAEYVQTILASGDGLMSILNDLLDISKIEAGKLELEAIPFELAALAGHACDLWGGAAEKKGVRLIRDFGGCDPLWLVGDPTRLRQVMVNLLSNAVKFTTEGEVRLSLGWSAGPAGMADLELTVADTGPGVPDGKRGALFQSFSQADSSITRQFGGTGLGLAICRNLVRLMGGDITLDGDLGHGSVFRVRLALPIAEAVTERPDGAQPDALSLDGLRVLVVDDNAVNLAVATTLLEAVGMVVGRATNGAEALAALAAEPFDLVLMDVHMPVMDGVEALRRIRAGEAGPADRLVVALTADAMAGVDTGLIDAGFDAVESKPINAANLIGTMATVLAGSARVAAPVAARVSLTA